MFSGKMKMLNGHQAALRLLTACFIAVVSLPAAAAQQTLMVYGDSLVAGYGLNAGEGFPEQLQQALDQDGYDVKVLNAGVSGDTTAGGLARLDWTLSDTPDAMIIVLGGNDLLRGLNPPQTRENLRMILERVTAKGIPVLLCGMLAPVNLGPEYRQQFDSIYPELAREFGADLYPFFLDGVALRPELNLPDGMHPNTAGIAEITRSVLPHARALLKKG